MCGGGGIKKEYSNRFGVYAPPYGSGFCTSFGVALLVNAALTVAGAAVGNASRYIAATPAVSGDDIDVPDMFTTWKFELIPAEGTFTPGANRSIAPKFEK